MINPTFVLELRQDQLRLSDTRNLTTLFAILLIDWE